MEMINPFLDLPGDAMPQEDPISPFWAGVTAFNTGVERHTHGMLQPLLESGLFGENIKKGSQQAAKKREEDYQRAYKDNPTIAGLLSTVGGIGAGIPLMAIPGMGQTALARGLTSGAMQGGLYGAGQYVEGNDWGQRGINALVGGGLGAAIPLGMAGIGKVTSPIANYLFPKSKIMSQTLNAIDNADEMFANKEAARRIGFNASPAESSGNTLLSDMQGSAGNSEAGAKMLQTYGREHLAQQKSAIGGLMDDITPNRDSATFDVRKAAQQVIKNEDRALQAKASPFYKQSENAVIPEEQFAQLMQDPVISNAYQKIVKDPAYQKALSGASPNSIKYLDQVKKFINEQSTSSGLKGKRYTAGIYNDSAKSITGFADEISPDYKTARGIYASDAPAVQALKESQLGRIADLSDTQIKNVSKMIFDPSQTDIKVMGQLRDKIGKQSPAAWNQIVRNEMERRLDKSTTGSNFYRKFLEGDRDFNQILEATKNIPGANQKLLDMKSAFKNIINPDSAKTAARNAKVGMNQSRNSLLQSVKDITGKFLGGRYDKAFVEFITNPKWDVEIKQFMKSGAKTPAERALKYGNILGRIGAAMGGQESAQPLTRPQETVNTPVYKSNEKNPFLDL